MKRKFIILISFLPLFSCKKEEQITPTELPYKSKRNVRSRVRNFPHLPPPESKKTLLKRDWGSIGPNYLTGKPNEGEIREAFTEVRNFPLSRDRDRALGFLISRSADLDDLALAQELLFSWDRALIDEWLDAASRVINELAKSDLEGAIALVENRLPKNTQARQWVFLLRNIPLEERAAYLGRMPEGMLQIYAASEMLHPWLEVDAEAATQWLDQFIKGRSEGERSELKYRHSYGGIKAVSAEAAMNGYRWSENPEARELLANLAWEKADEDSRDRWYLELSETLPNLMEKVWEQQIYSDPRATAESLTAEQVANLDRRVASRLFNRWSEKNKEEALEWGITQNRPEVANVLRAYYQEDPRSVRAVAQRIPPSRELDRSLESMILQSMHWGHLERSLELLELVSDQKTKNALWKKIEKVEQERTE